MEHTPAVVDPETTETGLGEDDEYDEALVYVEFTGIGVTDVLDQANPEFKVIGLLENDPKLQLGGQVYAGTIEDTVGTNVFFEETQEPTPEFDEDLDQAPAKWFKFDCTANKELIVKRIYTKKKVEQDNS